MKELEHPFLPANFPTVKQISAGFAKGKSLAALIPLEPPAERLAGSLQRFRERLSAGGAIPEPLWNLLEREITSAHGIAINPPDSASASDAAVSNEQEATDDVASLYWLMRELFKPYYYQFARRLPPASIDLWQRGACPCCGGPPKLALLTRESGMRRLWCDLCALDWPFARLECPFCGNRDAELLANLEFGEPLAYRIAVCEQCKGYLCTLDERKLPETAAVRFEREALAIQPLEIVADRQGYRWPGGSTQ
jgi:FdhE protein